MATSSSLPAWALIVFMAVMPLEGLAQSTKKVPRVGLIFNVVPLNQVESNSSFSAFRSELVRLGWTHGRNIEILWRSLEGDPSRISATLDELLRRQVDVIVLGSSFIAGEAQKKSRTVAIVTVGAFDPVGTGLASDLRRPGANITGVIQEFDVAIYGKRVALFREVLPGLARLAYFTWDHPYSNTAQGRETNATIERKAHELGVVLISYRVRHVEEVEAALADAKRKHADGALFDTSGIFYPRQAQALIDTYAVKQRIPVMYSAIYGAETGGLLAYGTKGDANFEKAAQFVDRILKGANPGDLPFEQVGNYLLYVNEKSAKAIGLTIPSSILMQADQVFE
jgi:putative ABC transport system substrate-binding protein